MHRVWKPCSRVRPTPTSAGISLVPGNHENVMIKNDNEDNAIKAKKDMIKIMTTIIIMIMIMTTESGKEQFSID